MAPQDVTHRLVADDVAQFLQFTLNPLKTPVILTGEPHYQALDLPVDPWSPTRITSSVGPLETDQLLVPTEQRCRFHDPNDLAHRFDRAPRAGSQLGTQHHQG